MKEITEDYISFETAKLLKEKGFIVPYDSFRGVYINGIFKRLNPGSGYGYNSDDEVIAVCSLQMATKWLIREYRLFVNVVPSVEGYYWTEKWHSYVEDLNKKYPFGKFLGTFNFPEEATEVAIKYCLEKLI